MTWGAAAAAGRQTEMEDAHAAVCICLVPATKGVMMMMLSAFISRTATKGGKEGNKIVEFELRTWVT